jgi:hypothetical protein
MNSLDATTRLGVPAVDVSFVRGPDVTSLTGPLLCLKDHRPRATCRW